MNFKPTLIGIATSLLVCGSLPAFAQSNAVIEELKEEIRKLREEVNALKKERGAGPAQANWGDRIEQLEIKSKDAGVAGDIGGSIRVPGSETSLRVYGFAEAHLIHDLNEKAFRYGKESVR